MQDDAEFATALNRSESAVGMIREAIAGSLGMNDPRQINLDTKLDCKGFFAEHGDVLRM